MYLFRSKKTFAWALCARDRQGSAGQNQGDADSASYAGHVDGIEAKKSSFCLRMERM